MSEGGWLPWKLQKIKNHRGPMGNYCNIRHELPDPPRGMKWVKDESTREWSVVPITDSVTKDAVAVPISSSSSSPSSSATATIVQAQEIIPGIAATVNDSTTNNNMENVMQAEAVAIVDPQKEDKDDKNNKSIVTKAAAAASDNDELVFVEHEVKPTDTFQGICLKYNVTPTTVRQYNNFSGSNLRLGPEILVIPITLETLTTRGISSNPIQRTTEQINIASFMDYFPKGRVNRREAKAYLDMNDGDLEAAVINMRDDMEWDRKHGKSLEATVILPKKEKPNLFGWLAKKDKNVKKDNEKNNQQQKKDVP